jgi:hypothetical protein
MGKMDVEKPYKGEDKGFGSPGDDRYGGKEVWARQAKKVQSLPDDTPTGNPPPKAKSPTAIGGKRRAQQYDDYVKSQSGDSEDK